MNPLISVIIPIYNAEKYINRCIESVVNQTYNDIEIILVDDGSHDLSLQECKKWADKDSRIKVLHKKNEGVSLARNCGLDIAKGEFILFVDSDDYLSLDSIAVMYERIIRDNSTMVVGKYINVYSNKESMDELCSNFYDAVLTRDDVFELESGSYHLYRAIWNKLYKRTIFEKIKFTKHRCAEDLFVFPEIVNNCTTISCVDKITYHYCQINSSITHTRNDELNLDVLDAMLHYSRFLIDHSYVNSGYAQYTKCVKETLAVQNRERVSSLFDFYFTKEEQRRYTSKLDLKSKIIWYTIHNKALFSILKMIRNNRK